MHTRVDRGLRMALAASLLGGAGLGQGALTPSMPVARTGAGAALDPSTGRIALFGGTTDVRDGHLWELDGTAWHLRTWQGDGPTDVRPGCVAQDTVRRRLVCYSGAETWEWDGVGWSLRLANSPPGTAAHGMTFDGARGLLLGEQNGRYVVWGWDGTTWTTVAPAGPVVLTYAPPVMAFDPLRGEILLFGGAELDRYTLARLPSLALHRWNGSAWSEVPFAGTWPQARYQAAFAFDPSRGVVVLHGGLGGAYGDENVAQVAEWNGANWTSLQPAPAAHGHSLVWHPGSAALLTVGGDTGQVHAWDGAQWRTPVSQGSPYFYRGVVAAGPRLLAVNTGTLYPSVSEWDGHAWRVLDQSAFPTVLTSVEGGSSTFDIGRGVLVTVAAGGTTFEWTQAVGWRQRVLPQSPPARAQPAIGYDPNRQRVVLFGGRIANTFLADTWEYDGTTWTPIATATAPPPRWQGAMAFDPASQRLLLVGGHGGASFGIVDAWALQAGTWVPLPAPAGGNPTTNPLLALDRTSNQVVHFDDITCSRWTGTAWVPIASVTPVRAFEGMGADPTTSRLLLFTPHNHSPATRVGPSSPAAVTRFGVGCVQRPEARLVADLPWLGHPRFLLEAHGVDAGGLCVFGLATATASQRLGNCTLLLGGSLLTSNAVANGSGVATLFLPIPLEPALRGAVVFAQTGTLGSSGLVLTDGLRLVVGD